MDKFAVNIIFFVFLCLEALEVSARPKSDLETDVKPKVVLFNQLYLSSVKFKCQPQPRAFLSETLIDEKLGTIEMLAPNSVVLHRCDGQSGCCLSHNQICVEQESEQIIFQFKVMDKFSNPAQPKFIRNIEVPLFNHTVCNCSIEHNPPKRHYVHKVDSLTSAGQSIMKNYVSLIGLVPCIFYLLT